MSDAFLAENNIGAVLTVAKDLGSFFPKFESKMNELFHSESSKFPEADHLVLPMMDDLSQEIGPHVATGVPFISAKLSEGKGVLVHCAQGKSRSSTLVVAYLMKTQGLSADKALELVRAQRPIAEPNTNFMTQLRALQT
mmetsp:Transcript_35386/g.80843  ORF Transcript_35386/g.80843 Transcript_35386/m.80843 type:complete len:139 (-) Transcript_35386:27-443(-)